MLFTEYRFLLFFLVVFGVTWALRGNTARKAWLLGASCVFYGAWDWRFLGLLWFSTAIDYVVALRMAREASDAARRPYLVLSLVVQLALLGFFKYFNFFVESASSFSAWLGLRVEARTLDIVLPVGISFYTFQTMSYTIDVYRRRLDATRSLLDFALFVAFFPQLVAGPIVRAQDFLPQLDAARRFANVAVRPALTLFLIGYVKKACLSDHLALVVDPVYAHPAAYGALDLWLASVLYALQIYCDFSGYSDMALATAGLLGYELVANFDAPYLARSIHDFWRRWHISLSTWFRDYLFIPLGGSRRSALRTALNLSLVFFLFGLWHGPRWNFVLAGMFHGLFLVLERAFAAERLPRLLGHAYTWAVLLTGWALFRPQTLGDSGAFLAGMWGLPRATLDAAPSIPAAWWLLPSLFLLAQWLRVRWRLDERCTQRIPELVYGPAFGLAVALVLPWACTAYAPFIYFQF